MKRDNLVGMKFNRLTVIEGVYVTDKNGKKHFVWKCNCECGNPKYVYANSYSLKSGKTKSCGCYQRERVSECRSITMNKYDLTGEYGIGYTRKNEIFYFDLEDYDLIKNYHWYIKKPQGYVMGYKDRENKEIFMHNLVTGVIGVDHIGGSETVNDNRKCNLRIYGDNKSEFQSRNMWNSKIKTNNTSGTTGVTIAYGNKWRARITVNGKRINLGLFTDKQDAIKARKEAEQKYFKEWSKDNSVLKYQIELAK